MNQKLARGKGKRCLSLKNLIPLYSADQDLSVQSCASKTLKNLCYGGWECREAGGGERGTWQECCDIWSSRGL